jgi:hypothetical protein
VTVRADAFTGVVLGIDIAAEDAHGTLIDGGDEVLDVIGVGQPNRRAAVELDDEVTATLGRLALLVAQRDLATALGPVSSTWSDEEAELRHRLGLPGALRSIRVDRPTSEKVDRAREVLAATPAVLGEIQIKGFTSVDPSRTTEGVLDLRRVSTSAVPGSGLVEVSTLVRDGIYPAAVTGITATLVEDTTGIVIGFAPFEYRVLGGAPAAQARVLVGSGRATDSVSLWLTSDLTRPMSSRLRSARRATALARRAAQAQRFGLGGDAQRLIEASRADWARIDRSFPEADAPTSEPFAGEVDDLFATGQLPI